MGSETVNSHELRRLEFVKTTSESVFSNTFKIAHAVYSSVRTRVPVPGSVDAQIKTAESKLNEFTAPRINQLQDFSGTWLTFADDKVDSAVKSAEAYKGSVLGWLRSKVPDNFVKAKDAYTQRAVDAIRSFKLDDAIAYAKLTSQKGYALVTQAPLIVFGQSLQLAQKTADGTKKTITDVWTALKSSASMDKVTGAVAPGVDFAKSQYFAVHDTVVAATPYKKFYNTTKGVAGWTQGTEVYKLSATHVYPVISPLADPVLTKAQPYVDSMFEQLKPITVSA